MKTSIEVQKALGRYRGPWYALLPSTVICLAFLSRPLIIADRHHLGGGAALSMLCWGAALAASWLIPRTVVSVQGIRLVWQFRFIPWSQVARLYWSKPGERDLLIGLTDGTRVKLPGLPGDRLPGVLILARTRPGAR